MGKLKAWMTAAREWLQGKKSILGGGVMIAAAVAGVFAGKLPVDQAVVVAGFGFSVCGMAAKAERHQSELLSALQDVGVAGTQFRAGRYDTAAVAKFLETTAAREVLKAVNTQTSTPGAEFHSGGIVPSPDPLPKVGE